MQWQHKGNPQKHTAAAKGRSLLLNFLTKCSHRFTTTCFKISTEREKATVMPEVTFTADMKRADKLYKGHITNNVFKAVTEDTCCFKLLKSCLIQAQFTDLTITASFPEKHIFHKISSSTLVIMFKKTCRCYVSRSEHVSLTTDRLITFVGGYQLCWLCSGKNLHQYENVPTATGLKRFYRRAALGSTWDNHITAMNKITNQFFSQEFY